MFTENMSVGDAVRLHPRVSEILASYHLGGCSHCTISEQESLAQVCMGYGVPIDTLIETLNELEIK